MRAGRRRRHGRYHPPQAHVGRTPDEMNVTLHRRRIPALIVSFALSWAGPSWAGPDGGTLYAKLGNLADLTLEELGNIVVESVSRRSQ